MASEIFIKGQKLNHKYSITLKEIFANYSGQIFTLTEATQLLERESIRLEVNEKLILEILDYRNQSKGKISKEIFFDFAGPFTMETVLDSHFLYNLAYQDTVIKVEIEKAEEKHNLKHTEAERFALVKEIFIFVSIILHTDFFSSGQPFYFSLTNLELDYIVLKCLSFFDLGIIVSIRDLAKIGNTANDLACKTQKEILLNQKPSVKDILTLSIYSGVIWWSDIKIQNQYDSKREEVITSMKTKLLELSNRGLSIDDFDIFDKEVLKANQATRIIYFLDDNGELAWDLFFINKIIEENININIVCVIHENPISNTANHSTLSYLLNENNDCYFKNLNIESRFRILREANKITAFDPRFMSNRLKLELRTSNFIISKGASNFEKLQYTPIPAYYLFTVYSKVSTILTGLDQFSGIFARGDPGSACFKNIQSYNGEIFVEKNLKNLHENA